MALTSTSVLMVDELPKMIAAIVHVPSVSYLLPDSLEHSQISAGRSDPGSFQIISLAPGPRACEILCALFKNRVSIFHSPQALQKVSPKAKRSGAHLLD